MNDETAVAALAAQIEGKLAQPVFFFEILEAFDKHPYRAILRAWSDVRTRRALARDLHGRYWLETDNKAKPN